MSGLYNLSLKKRLISSNESGKCEKLLNCFQSIYEKKFKIKVAVFSSAKKNARKRNHLYVK